MNVTDRILYFRDEDYRDFQSKLMPTVPKEKIIGVRTPVLRKLAKEMSAEEASEFMATLPHEYYEEDNLHAFLIEKIKDFDVCVSELDRFLPYVDNWATCDSMTPRVLGREPERLLAQIDIWLGSSECYTVRYALGLLLKFYLGEHFSDGILKRAARVESEEYYVKMMVAWFFATALTFHYEQTLPYLEKGVLDEWTRRKTVSKVCDSYRVDKERKNELRRLIKV